MSGILRPENVVAVLPALIGLLPVAFALYDAVTKRKK